MFFPGLVGCFFQPILDTESAIFADAMESEYMNSHGALDVNPGRKYVRLIEIGSFSAAS